MTSVLPTDHLLSWARRDGGHIEVRVRLARAAPQRGQVVVELSDGTRSLLADGEVTESGRVVSFRVSGPDLGRSAWQLTVRNEAGEPVGLRARLLAAPGQPVALLSGTPPDTRMRPPTRRQPPTLVHRFLRRVHGRLPAGARRTLVRVRDLARSTRPRRR